MRRGTKAARVKPRRAEDAELVFKLAHLLGSRSFETSEGGRVPVLHQDSERCAVAVSQEQERGRPRSTRPAVLKFKSEDKIGGLRPRERTAVEEAISFAFAEAGFADGGPTRGLVSPQLGDVYARLRARPEMEEIAHRLVRYVGGPGSWLFQRSDAPLSMGADSVVYVLAGLPEEERAAAMFLVLDRIWASLADSTRPTFVVVDEAWWLMRHPDTAAFLFRLVKTARKRRAGLTLVTQDVGDVLASPDGEAVITNSALQILLKQAPQAMPRLGEIFRLTRAEQSYLVNAQQGEGLLIAQGRRVPLQVVATDEEARLIEGRENLR